MSYLPLANKAIDEHGAIQHPVELAAVAGALPPLHRVLEIGVRFGGTLWFWRQIAQPDAKVLGVDVNIGQAIALGLGDFDLIQGDSQDPETRRRVEEYFEDHKLDLIFIDGDHDHPMADWEMYRTLLAPGGAIAFHDIAEGGQFWHDMRLAHSGTSLTVIADQVGWGLPTDPKYPGYGARLGIGVVFP